MTRELQHQPVAAQATADWLVPDANAKGQWLDCTFGHGGHSAALLTRLGKEATLFACDCDASGPDLAPAQLLADSRLQLIRADYVDLASSFDKSLSGIIADFGARIDHFFDPERGMSFSHDAALDMRFDQRNTTTAATLLNSLSQSQLQTILEDFAGEPESAAIARHIVSRRKNQPFTTTGQLVKCIAAAKKRSGKSHYATRTFQALRIAVNDENQKIYKLLEKLPASLLPGARVALITYHSLEQRWVMTALRSHRRNWRFAKRNARLSPREIADNHQARSARLNLLEFVA